MADRGVKGEALMGMVQALNKFMSELSDCVVQLQKDANTCADNMAGDEYSAKAIIRVNKCLGNYRKLYDSAEQLRDKMQAKYHQLDEISHILDGDDY